jgi:hypothetical protein
LRVTEGTARYSNETSFYKPPEILKDIDGRRYTVIDTEHVRTGYAEYYTRTIRRYEKRTGSDEENADEYQEYHDGNFERVLSRDGVLNTVPNIDRNKLSGGLQAQMSALLRRLEAQV